MSRRHRVAPIHNSAYQTLLAEASAAGLPSEIVRHLLWSINADPDLTAFATIAKNLSEILALIPQRMNLSLESVGLAGWDAAVDWVVYETPLLMTQVGPTFDQRPKSISDNPLLNKSITRHPIYGALWNTHESPELKPRFQALQAQVLIAHASLMWKHTSLAQYENYDGDDSILPPPFGAQAPGLTLRRLSHQKAAGELRALDPFQPAEAFAKSLRSYCARRGEQDASFRALSQQVLQEQVLAVVFFLEKVHGLRPWRSRDSGGGGGSGTGDPGYVEFQQQYAVDDEYGEGQFTVSLQIESEDAQSIEQLLQDDCSPYDDGPEIMEVSVPAEPPATARSVAMSALGDAGRKRHIALINQCLPFSYSVLTCDEIHDVHCGLLALYDDLIELKSKLENDLRLETVLIALVVLWTGSGFERARSLKVCEGRQGVEGELTIFLGSGIATGHWQIYSEFPRYKTNLTIPEESVRARTKYVSLPDVAGIGTLIQRAMEKRGQRISSRARLFRHSSADYKRMFRRTVETISGAERVTPAMWEKVLFQRIVDQTGDVTDGVAITGVSHVLANTKSYYCTPRVSDLIKTYLRVTQKLVSQCELGTLFDFDAYRIPNAANDLYVGSRACARREAVVQQVEALKDRIRSKASYRSWSDFVAYHNLYTFYTVQMLGFATGHRAITRPYLDASAVDEILAIAAISDKDTADRRRSRLGYIPAAVVLQLRYYEQHCAVVRAEEEQRILGNKTARLDTCYLLRSGRPGVDEVRPRNLAPYLSDFLGLPANAHRRFMRTELKEAGCHADFINAFMGHASFGEEPWGKFSSLSVESYREMMERYVVPLFSSQGWQPVRSLLAPGARHG